MKQLLIALMILLLCASPALAEEEPETLTEGAYEYYLTEEGAVLTRYTAPTPETAEVVLPLTIGDMPIIRYEFVFHEPKDTSQLRVIVPEGVTDFGNAFCESGSVSEIVLPASLAHIEEGSLFWGDPEITVHPDNPHFTCEGGFLIDTYESVLLYAAPSAAGKPLPAVRRIGSSSLANWLPHAAWGELELVIPEGVEEIGAYAFYDWEIKSVTLPEGLRLIESGAFECCLPAGSTVVIPASVEMIQYCAFGLYTSPEIEIVLAGTDTHMETAAEYALRTGEDWVLTGD